MNFLSKLARQFDRVGEATVIHEVNVPKSMVPKLVLASKRLRQPKSKLLDHMVMVGIDTVYDEVTAK